MNAPPPDFPYVLTAHAAEVVAERRIPLDWVKRVLAQPMMTEPDGEHPHLTHALASIPEYGRRVLR